MLPLHCDAQEFTNVGKVPDSAHAGLWYDRFFNQYDSDCKVGDDGKTSWIKTVVGSIGDEKKLESFAERQQALLEAYGGQSLVMSADWHFVTGMGNNHPVENGFAWHHTLGVPYLTGAAVKGMVRAWCEVWQEFDEERIKQWFGDTKKSGELIFFDAVPTAPVKLKADIMTPHYGDWYAEGDKAPKRDGSNVPADWHDPVPVPFLVVDKGALFQFAVAKRADSDIQLKEVTDALSNALQWLGAGAKTAAGYGRMITEKEYQKKQEAAQKQAQEAQQQKKNARQQTKIGNHRKGLTPAEIAKQKMKQKANKPVNQSSHQAEVKQGNKHQGKKKQQAANTNQTQAGQASMDALKALQEKYNRK